VLAFRWTLPGASKSMPTELPYHCQLNKIGRSQGRSSTAAAAYRSGERIVDERTGEIFDYTRKRGVEGSLIVLPGGGTMNRATLWNKVEKHHKRGDAVVCREIEVSLPRTFNAEQRRRLVQSYAAKLANKYGVAVDACIHAPHAVTDSDLIANPDQFFVTEPDGRRHNGNWHCHILMSACHCDAEGALGKKVVELDEMHCYRAGIPNAAQEQRPEWAALVNAALVDAGQVEYFVDHRSFEERGITDRLPTKHRGPAVTAIKRRGGQSDVADAQAAKQAGWLGRAVEAASEAVEAIEAELANAVREAAQAAAVVVAAVVAVAAPSRALAEAPEPVQEAPEATEAAAAPAVDRVALRAAVAAARAAAAAAVPEVEVVVSQAAAPQAPAVAAAEAAVPAPPTAAERLARLSARRERARQAADQAAQRAAPYWVASEQAEAARAQLDELARERLEREQAIAERPVLHRIAALLGDPDKQRIAEIDVAAGRAGKALQRAEVAMGKAQPLHDAQAGADAALDSLDRAVATAERQCKVEAERLRIAALIEQQADRQDEAGQKDAAGRPRGA
jgi:hypothetical protein